MTSFDKIIDEIKKLSNKEKDKIRDFLAMSCVSGKSNLKEYVKEERFSKGAVCPICGSVHVVRNGSRKDGTQRYICRTCNKSFTITTNTIVAATKKDMSVWEKYIDCMMEGLSIRESAVRCNINRNTAFLWRHKILDALQNMAESVKLDGIIEGDETFFPVSYKGNHTNGSFIMPRESHHRGKQIHSRGLSHEQVCVPCAVNRNGLSIAKVSNLGRVSTSNLHTIFDNRILKNSTLCTDTMNSYQKFAETNHIKLVQLKTGLSKKGIYHIQHINAYHSTLKKFMGKFNGVSTKYLNNYLVWNNLVNYSKETWTEKKNIFMSFVFTTEKTVLVRNLNDRPALPICA